MAFHPSFQLNPQGRYANLQLSLPLVSLCSPTPSPAQDGPLTAQRGRRTGLQSTKPRLSPQLSPAQDSDGRTSGSCPARLSPTTPLPHRPLSVSPANRALREHEGKAEAGRAAKERPGDGQPRRAARVPAGSAPRAGPQPAPGGAYHGAAMPGAAPALPRCRSPAHTKPAPRGGAVARPGLSAGTHHLPQGGGEAAASSRSVEAGEAEGAPRHTPICAALLVPPARSPRERFPSAPCARPPPQLPPAPAPRPGPALAPAVALRRRPAAAFSTRLRRGASLSLSIRPLLAVPGRRPPGQAGKGSRRRARRPGCPEGTRRRRRPRPPRSRCRSPCRSPLPSCS